MLENEEKRKSLGDSGGRQEEHGAEETPVAGEEDMGVRRGHRDK